MASAITAADAALSLPAIRAPGGGALGTGMGRLASGLPTRIVVDFALEPAGLRRRLASFIALRLMAPRTGMRGTNTQPMCGTGLPPIRRPSSNNQSYCPWNSW